MTLDLLSGRLGSQSASLLPTSNDPVLVSADTVLINPVPANPIPANTLPPNPVPININPVPEGKNPSLVWKRLKHKWMKLMEEIRGGSLPL